MKRFVPEVLWVQSGEEESAVARQAIASLPGVPVRSFEGDAEPRSDDFAAGKRGLVLRRKKGTFLRACPAGTTGLVCCNLLVVDFALHCPMDCSYCFLQEYLSRGAMLTAYTNPEEGLAEIRKVVVAHPDRPFRIGTGELSDSLALDPITHLAPRIVDGFRDLDNATLEFKTKSNCIENLLDLDHRGRCVVSWSMSPREIVESDEHATASLDERIHAARIVQERGYKVGLHFDPIVHFEGWEEGYRRTIAEIFAGIDSSMVAWTSLGSLRMTPQLERRIRNRGKGEMVLGSELVACADGKARVWQGLRMRMLSRIREMLENAAPTAPKYLCMEAAPVWNHVMGEAPADRTLALRLAAGAQY